MTATTTALEPVRFEGFEEFTHFENGQHPKCFACNSRLMRTRPISVQQDFILMPALKMVGNDFFQMSGSWLVYPRVHATSIEMMPDHWLESVRRALRILDLGDQSYGTSTNWGPAAGQTTPHAHTWIILRGNGEAGLLSENRGLATILDDIKERYIPRD